MLQPMNISKRGEGKRLKIVAKSGSNYTGTKEITYTIAPRPIADAVGKAASDIEVQGLDGLEELYTGSPITVSGIKVLRNAAELTEITDYVITYGNNTNAREPQMCTLPEKVTTPE